MPQDKLDQTGPQTKAVHAAREFNQTHAISPPIWQTTTFSADSTEQFAELGRAIHPAEFYTRYGNPTHTQVEATLATLEGGEAALVTSSGMGAIFTLVTSLVRCGDHVVAQRNHYAGTTTLLRDWLPRWGIEVTLVDQTQGEEFGAAVRPTTKLIYAETPVNPLMDITDLRAIARLGREHGITTIADNTFATPINQRPLDLGIDLVVHSATKFLGGHHDLTAGAIIGPKAALDQVWEFAIVTGATLSPFDGWLLLRGLRTLGLRVMRQNENALALARFLEAHPKVARVYYPGLASHPQHELARQQMSGFTGVLSVELRDRYQTAERFMTSLKLATQAASLGGYETLVVLPSAMWGVQISPEQARAAGLPESLVRISVGLEDEADLINDFAQALAQV